MAEELCRDYLAQQDDTADKNDLSALFNIGYGLYVITSNDGKKDNGLNVFYWIIYDWVSNAVSYKYPRIAIFNKKAISDVYKRQV